MNKKMADYIDNTLVHKQYVLESARILSKYLIEHDNLDMALRLIERCSTHDMSKFSLEELKNLIKLSGNENFTNPSWKLSEEEKEIISVHWANNPHHPEHFKNINDMTELDIMEMACDCYSRSIEFNTDLMNFIEIRQKQRFKLPIEMYEKYKNYCLILISGGQKQEQLENNSGKVKRLDK